MSVLKLVPYSFDYQSFIVSFEMRSVRLSMIFFFCRVVLAIWHPLKFPVNFRMVFFSFSRKRHRDFDRLAWNL